jgi:hypothetical protein
MRARAILCFTLYTYIDNRRVWFIILWKQKRLLFMRPRETSRSRCFQNNEIAKRLHIIGFLSDSNSFVVARSRPPHTLFSSSAQGIQSKSAIVNFSPVRFILLTNFFNYWNLSDHLSLSLSNFWLENNVLKCLLCVQNAQHLNADIFSAALHFSQWLRLPTASMHICTYGEKSPRKPTPTQLFLFSLARAQTTCEVCCK